MSIPRLLTYVQQLMSIPRLVINNKSQEQDKNRDAADQPNLEADYCEVRWNKMLQLWSQSDRLVTELIAHAKGETQGQPMYQLEGITAEKIISDYELISSDKHECARPTCEKDDSKMLKLIKKNLEKTIMKETKLEEKSSHEEERVDETYQKWKEWRMRHEKEENMKKTRLEESLKKEKQWDLYRECCKLLEENKARWLERRESEKQKILEIEK